MQGVVSRRSERSLREEAPDQVIPQRVAFLDESQRQHLTRAALNESSTGDAS
jgi:hypothetical protein